MTHESCSPCVTLQQRAAGPRSRRAHQASCRLRQVSPPTPDPSPLPAPFADSLKKLDALTADSTNRLSLSLAVDAIGAAIGAVEPRWLKAFVGGAGWGPIATFLVGYVYEIPPLTALCAMEESGYISWARVVPTATIGWLMHQKFVDEAGLREGVRRLARTLRLA